MFALGVGIDFCLTVLAGEFIFDKKFFASFPHNTGVTDIGLAIRLPPPLWCSVRLSSVRHLIYSEFPIVVFLF